MSKVVSILRLPHVRPGKSRVIRAWTPEEKKGFDNWCRYKFGLNKKRKEDKK